MPTALTKPSTVPSVWSQISGPVVRTWTSRLATLSNWLAKIAPCGCSRASRSAMPRGDFHVIVGVAVRRRRHFDERRAERAQRVLLLLALRLRDDDHRLHAERIADDGEADAGVSRGAFDDQPAGLSWPLSIASVTMPSAARSFTDRPGFMNSALPRIVQPVSSDARRSLISGVLPMASSVAVSESACARLYRFQRDAAVAQIIGPAALAPRLGAVAGLDPAAGRLEEVLRRFGEPFELIARGAASPSATR